MSSLEGSFWEMEKQLDDEVHRRIEAERNLKQCTRRLRDLSYENEELGKTHARMQDLVDKLQQKVKTYRQQVEEAEEIAALNLAKCRRAQQQLDDAEERAEYAEQQAARARWKGQLLEPLPMPRF